MHQAVVFNEEKTILFCRGKGDSIEGLHLLQSISFLIIFFLLDSSWKAQLTKQPSGTFYQPPGASLTKQTLGKSAVGRTDWSQKWVAFVDIDTCTVRLTHMLEPTFAQFSFKRFLYDCSLLHSRFECRHWKLVYPPGEGSCVRSSITFTANGIPEFVPRDQVSS